MLSDEILVVEKVEYHLWKTCPCQACRLERERREPSGSFTPIKRLSVSAASLFGYPALKSGQKLDAWAMRLDDPDNPGWANWAALAGVVAGHREVMSARMSARRLRSFDARCSPFHEFVVCGAAIIDILPRFL